MVDVAERNVAASAVATDDDAQTTGPKSRAALLSWQDMTFIKATEALLSSQYMEEAGWHRDVETCAQLPFSCHFTHPHTSMAAMCVTHFAAMYVNAG